MRVENIINKCACGCGGDIVYKAHHKYYGISKYLCGHSSRINPVWKGKKLSEEHVIKLKKSHTGYVMPEEQKKKIGDANRGAKHYNYGKAIPLESRRKMAEAKGMSEYIIDDIERARAKSQRANDIRRSTASGRLRHSISTGVRDSLRKGKMGKKLKELLPYSINDLKKHLEKQFKPGMTWNNYGEWHVDHKIPIAAFNFNTSKDLDFERCWALSNLQPLWAIENFRKGGRLSRPFQPFLRLSYAS